MGDALYAKGDRLPTPDGVVASAFHTNDPVKSMVAAATAVITLRMCPTTDSHLTRDRIECSWNITLQITFTDGALVPA
jgi:hypothetical protein